MNICRCLWLLGCLFCLPRSWALEGAAVLEDATVTARHREEQAQQVPIALSVLDGEELDAAGLHRLQDIQQRVPGLVVSGHNARYMGLGLRGFGATTYNDGLEGSVGMFVDGVYQSRQGMAFGELLDVERIEVLRGPQGTLFGKNTSAGALNVITRQPTPYYESSAEVTYGSHGLRQYRGSLSGPLVEDVLAGRLSFFDSARDGLVDNLHDGTSLNDRDGRGLRGQLLWTPTDTFSARLIGEYGLQDDVGHALTSSHYSQQTRERAAFMNHTLPPADPKRRQVDVNEPYRSSTRQNAASLELNWDLDAEHRLTSISAYREWTYRDGRDGDGTSLSVARADTGLDHRQFSQELRLSGVLGGSLDYLVGAYYQHQRLNRELQVGFGDDAAGWFAGDQRAAIEQLFGIRITDPAQIPSALLDGARQTSAGEQNGDSRALFGQLSWRPRPRLELTAGLRYTQERKDGWITRDATGLAPLDGLPIEYQQGGGLLRYLALGDAYRRADSIDESNVSGLLGASYRFSEALLGYASWSRGYKAGGINFDVVGPHTEPTFGEERATSLEVGFKARFWEGRGLLDLALYQTDVDDYQALTYSPPATLFAPPLRDNLINVGKVRLRGVEIDSAWRLHSRLDLRLGLAWSDARYRSFPNAPCPPASGQWSCDLGGDRVYNAPEWNASAGLEYTHPLSAGLEAYGGIDYSFRSGYHGTLEGGEGSYQPSHALTDLRLGLRRNDHGWEVEGWVRNLFDRHSITAVYALLGAGDYGVLPGDPRMAGVTLRARY